MTAIEAPWVGNPPEDEVKTVYCPVCGREAEDLYYSVYDSKVIGCDNCIRRIDAYEWEGDL